MKQTSQPVAAEQVVAYVRGQIESGELSPGDRLPAERDLAARIGVSRPSVRTGLRALSAMGVVVSRHGSGTFITDGPPVLDSKPLRLLAALHRISDQEIFEARLVLELGAAGLAAERASGEQLASIAEELMGMFAALEDTQAFLLHDIRFHRAIATASGNPILAALVEMVSELFYEQRRKTTERGRDLRVPAESHRRIYDAIRRRDPDLAREKMQEHLRSGYHAQQLEESAPESGSSDADRSTGRGESRHEAE